MSLSFTFLFLTSEQMMVELLQCKMNEIQDLMLKMKEMSSILDLRMEV